MFENGAGQIVAIHADGRELSPEEYMIENGVLSFHEPYHWLLVTWTVDVSSTTLDVSSCGVDAVDKGDADHSAPTFAKPLAPLPEWLEKVGGILEEKRR